MDDDMISPVLQCVAVCCSVLQCVAVCCSVLQCVAVRTSTMDDEMISPEHVCDMTYMYHDSFMCAAVCCSVL